MSKSKQYTKRQLPPCPDPQQYVLVKTKDSRYFWRLKRGTLTPATLNAAFAENLQLTCLLSPACKKITSILQPFTIRMETKNLHNFLLTGLKKHYKQYRQPGFQYLKGLDLQPQWPLHNLLKQTIYTGLQDDFVSTRFLINQFSVTKFNNLLTEYYFEAVLLCGDILMHQELELWSQQSELFSFSEPPNKECSFSFAIPKQQPWMLLLKVACFEGHQQAAHPKHYAMKILETGQGH